MRKFLILFFITVCMITNGQNKRDRLIFEQSNLEKNVLFQNYVQRICVEEACFPINIACTDYKGKVIVYSDFLFDFYINIYLSADEKQFFNQNDYYIFAYKLILGDTLKIDKKFNKLKYNNSTFKKVSNSSLFMNLTIDNKPKMIEYFIDTAGNIKKDGEIDYQKYNIEEIILKFFEWGILITYFEEDGKYRIYQIRKDFQHDDLTNLVNNSLFQYFDTLKVKNFNKEILIIADQYYPDFEIKDSELIKRKVKKLDKNQINDYINTFGNNFLFLELTSIGLDRNVLVLRFCLSDIMENPYMKGNYRQMLFDDEFYVFNLNEENQWVKK